MKIHKNLTLTVFVVIATSFAVQAQLFTSYYYDYKLLNPALVGIQDKHVITTVYSGFPSSTEASTYYGSYETGIASIKSGVGALGYYGELGVISTFRAGLFYSKQIAFNEKSGLRIGTQMTYNREKVDYSKYQQLHLQDPLLMDKSDKLITTSVNLDLGVLYYSDIVNAGVSVTDIFNEEGESNRMWDILAFRDFKIGNGFKVTPSLVYFKGNDYYRFDVNSIFEIKQWILIGGGYSMFERGDDVSFSAGLNVKDWVQIIGHAYSSENDDYRERNDGAGRVEFMIRANIPHKKKTD